MLKQLVQGERGSVVGGIIISNSFDNLKIVKVIKITTIVIKEDKNSISEFYKWNKKILSKFFIYK